MTISGDDASLLAMAATRMSTLSIAQTMGAPWTEAKVYNRLSKLRCSVEREAPPAPEPRAPRAAKPKIEKQATPLLPELAASPGRPVVRTPTATPPVVEIQLPVMPTRTRQAKVFGPHSLAPREPRPRGVGPSPYDTAHPRPPPPDAAAVRRSRPPAPHVAGPGDVERLKPLTAERLRYARWFLDADWSLAETAGLFDVDAGELAHRTGAAVTL